jgi:TPR repeat protein
VAELEWVAEIEGGDPRTLFETALRVRDGRGLPKVRQAAITWLSVAGSRGVPAAYYELGLTHLDAPRRELEVKAGIGSLAMAGREGFVPAQVEMGRRYAAGDQVQQWDHAAYVWLLMAAGNGADVAALLDEVGGRLSDEDRRTARAEAEKGIYYPLPPR